jgi:hypothetical protein
MRDAFNNMIKVYQGAKRKDERWRISCSTTFIKERSGRQHNEIYSGILQRA